MPLPLIALTRLAGAAADLVPGGPDWRQRLGHDARAAAGGIWLHGASVGEIASAGPLLAVLAAEGPVVATANTVTGRARAAAAGLPARLAPIDTPQAVARFLDALRPAVAVTVENELWPVRSAMLHRRGVAQVVVGARLSERSAARWHRLPGLARTLLGRIDALSAQDPDSEARLLGLGLRPGAVLARVNLKRWGAAAGARLRPGRARAATILAASTHEAEEAAILDALAAAHAQGARIIVAPRHPQRFGPVAAAMTARGLAPARRSAGAGTEAAVLLADTMGEMPMLCAAAGIVVTGGSFRPIGGHTPWEAAAQSCAILHGPHVANFTRDYAELDRAGAARRVAAGELAAALVHLVGNPEAAAMGARARALLDTPDRGAVDLLEVIRRLRDSPRTPISGAEDAP